MLTKFVELLDISSLEISSGMLNFVILVFLFTSLNAMDEVYYRQRHGYLVIGDEGSNPECIDSERHTTRIGCAVLCNIEASCKSISYRKTDGCCALNTQQLYDFDVNYEENPLWDYYGSMDSKVTMDEWTLVFKAVSGTGVNIWDAWSQSGLSHDQHPAYFSKYVTDPSYPFYRSHWLDDWSSAGVTEVKLGLYENGTEVAFVTFNGTGSTRDDWFSLSRLLLSTWQDLPTSTPAIFSLQGDTFRKFYITNAVSLVDCDNFGWLIVLSQQANICEFDKEAPPPQFLYSKGDAGNYFKNKLYGLAQMLAVFAKF